MDESCENLTLWSFTMVKVSHMNSQVLELHSIIMLYKKRIEHWWVLSKIMVVEK